MLTFDVDFDLICGILDRAIDVDVNIEDNQILEVSKHYDDSTLINEKTDAHSSSTSRVNVETMQVSLGEKEELDHPKLLVKIQE